MDDVVDGHTERHARRHHGADVDEEMAVGIGLEEVVAPAHRSEHHHRGEGGGEKENEARRRCPTEEDHHRDDDREVPDEADLQAIEERVLRLVDQRHEPRVVDRDAVDTLLDQAGEDRVDLRLEVGLEIGVVDFLDGTDAGADPPQLLLTAIVEDGVAEVVAGEEVFAMGEEPPVEDVALRAGTEAKGPGCRSADPLATVARVEAPAESHRGERAPHLAEQADLRLDLADEFHPFEKVERAGLLIDADEDLHRHQRAEMGLEPAVVLTDSGLGGEQPHQLHAALHLRHPVADTSHHQEAGGGHEAVIAGDPLAGAPPAAVLHRAQICPFAVSGRIADELGWEKLEGRRHEEDEDQEAQHDADRREDAEHPNRHKLAHCQRRQADGGRAGGQRQWQEGVNHRASGGPLLDAGLSDLVAVVVGQMDRPAGGGDVHQRRHGEEDRVDGVA